MIISRIGTKFRAMLSNHNWTMLCQEFFRIRFLLPFFEHQNIRVFDYQKLQISISEQSFSCQSFALGQSIRANQSFRALVFRVSWKHSCTCRLKQDIKHIRVYQSQNVREFLSCLSNPLLFKISFLFSPFLSAVKNFK